MARDHRAHGKFMDKKSLENGKNQHEELELEAAKRVVAWI
jgi:hypothetical protein